MSFATRLSGEINRLISESFSYLGAGEVQSLTRLARLVIQKQKMVTDTYSGLVLAGFGEKQFFPVLQSYKVGGVFEGHLKYVLEETLRVDVEPQFRGSAGAGRAHASREPGHGRRGRDRGAFCGCEGVEGVMRALARAIDGLELPAVEKISESRQDDPFQVLIATLLSARTQDATTLAASTRLFDVARTPRTMAKLSVRQIERLIYPVSFYRHKARHVKDSCRILVEDFGGRVPMNMDELLTLPGVGRKTANLVLILAFKSRRNICVDTHVHRISNRLGWVRTRTPDETERALYLATEKRWWPYLNLYLVTWGQNVCRPIYPRCGECVIAEQCPRIGVARASSRAAPTRRPSSRG